MLYRYISNRELIELYTNRREAYVFSNIQTKDIDEYIGNLFILLKNNGLDINKFIQPKIIYHNKKNNTYTFILIVRANEYLCPKSKFVMDALCNNMNIGMMNLYDYITKGYNNRVKNRVDNTEIDDIQEVLNGNATMFLVFTSIENSRRVNSTVTLTKDSKNNISSVEIRLLSKKYCDYKHKIDTKLLNNNIEDIIAVGCRDIFKVFRLDPKMMVIADTNKKLKTMYSIVPTSNSLKITKI